jgi:hypothetical protein
MTYLTEHRVVHIRTLGAQGLRLLVVLLPDQDPGATALRWPVFYRGQSILTLQ